MSREKGATYLDKLCHKFYDEPKGVGKKTDYVCRLCGGTHPRRSRRSPESEGAG